MDKRVKDLTGQIFGRLTALKYKQVTMAGRKRTCWICRCSCGAVHTVSSAMLLNENTSSCGCLRNELVSKRFTKHGEKKNKCMSVEYSLWINMRQRCYNTRRKDYRHYGGRGITICKKWRDSFSVFLDDVGKRPSNCTSLDRINNEKGYEPGNTRWTTQAQQVRNYSRTKLVTFMGSTLCLKDMCGHVQLPYHTVISRLKCGWSMLDALTMPSYGLHKQQSNPHTNLNIFNKCS